ncbi:uncharacterized protein LOC144332670 [Macaca mulatta]
MPTSSHIPSAAAPGTPFFPGELPPGRSCRTRPAALRPFPPLELFKCFHCWGSLETMPSTHVVAVPRHQEPLSPNLRHSPDGSDIFTLPLSPQDRVSLVPVNPRDTTRGREGKSGSVCHCPSFSVSLSFFPVSANLSLSLSLCHLSVNLPISLCLSLTLSVSFSLCQYVSLCIFSFCLCQSVCLSLSLCKSLCLSLLLLFLPISVSLCFLSFSLSLPICLCLPVNVSVSFSVCFFYLHLCQSLSLSASLSVCSYLSLSLPVSAASVSLFVYVSLSANLSASLSSLTLCVCVRVRVCVCLFSSLIYTHTQRAPHGPWLHPWALRLCLPRSLSQEPRSKALLLIAPRHLEVRREVRGVGFLSCCPQIQPTLPSAGTASLGSDATISTISWPCIPSQPPFSPVSKQLVLPEGKCPYSELLLASTHTQADVDSVLSR